MSAQIGKIIKGKGKNIKGIIKNMSEIIEHNKRVGRANPNHGSCAPEERGLLTVKMLNRNQETTMREGLRACKRVAFLRRRHKNAECIARCIRFPGALPRARGNNWALHNVGCARHSPNKFGSALACTTFQPAPIKLCQCTIF